MGVLKYKFKQVCCVNKRASEIYIEDPVKLEI